MILGRMDFRGPADGWVWPEADEECFTVVRGGCDVQAAAPKKVTFLGSGVHTRNGDSIELHLDLGRRRAGSVVFGYDGGFEWLHVELDLRRRRVTIRTSECDRRQPVASAPLGSMGGRHVLRIDKADGAGGYVKLTDVRVRLDGREVLTAEGLNVLGEMGVIVQVAGSRATLRRFVHRGPAFGVPEYFHVGGWQVLNRPDIDANLASIYRGLRAAAEARVRLLLTPETSLTGLFARDAVTRRAGPIAHAERKLRRFLRGLKGAPYLVTGLPVWKKATGGPRAGVRYNVSRVYDPDGHIIADGAKVHSCEPDFHHGLRLNEFEVEGVPVSMHVCHDGRYPELWTLPVMFGARLVLHPSNGGTVGGTVDAFESRVGRATTTTHAFYLGVGGGGGSALFGPGKYRNLLAVSAECGRDNPSFPDVGEPVECLLHRTIRVHDAFGYWPVRSFRAGEQTAAAYVDVYRCLGGRNLPDG